MVAAYLIATDRFRMNHWDKMRDDFIEWLNELAAADGTAPLPRYGSFLVTRNGYRRSSTPKRQDGSSEGAMRVRSRADSVLTSARMWCVRGTAHAEAANGRNPASRNGELLRPLLG